MTMEGVNPPMPGHQEYAPIRQKAVTPKKSAPVTTKLAEADRAGTIEVVKIADLKRDPAYQRPISQDLVDDIARNWDIVAADLIVVSRRQNGDLYIVNGQHRSAAAMQAGETEVLAHVINGLTAKDEAILRLKGNKRRNDTAQDRFRAQVSAADPESLDIVRIVESLGGRVNFHPDAKYGINTVSSLETVYRKDGGVLLLRTLELIVAAFGNLDGRHSSVGILKSIAWLLENHTDDNMDMARLRERIQIVGVDELDRKARNHKVVMGGALWMNYYRAIIEAYNAKLSEAKMLTLRLSKSSKFGERGKD